jgi:cytochrome c553
MKIVKQYILFVFILLLPLTMTATTGKELYQTKQCQICHGETGTEKIQGMPRLWGQQKQYLINQMENILSGKRDNSYSQLMKMNYTSTQSKESGSMKNELTAEDIKVLANFFNNLKR